MSYFFALHYLQTYKFSERRIYYMKKRSLLALSLASLVALVGCGKKGESSSKQNGNSLFRELIVDLLGSESKKFIEEANLEELQEEFGPNCKGGLEFGVQWTYDEEFTPADLSAELIFQECFVGTAESPALYEGFYEKYGADLFEVNPFGYNDTHATYLGSFVYNGFKKEQVFVGAQWKDVTETDATSGETTTVGVSFFAYSASFNTFEDFKAAKTLAQGLFAEEGGNQLFAPIQFILPSWAEESAKSEQMFYIEFEEALSDEQFKAKYFDPRPSEDPEADPLPSLWDEFALENEIGFEGMDVPYGSQGSYGSYYQILSLTETTAVYNNYYLQYVAQYSTLIVIVSLFIEADE